MKIVLAYSGGLDTSVALHWLKERYDAEVIAFCADIGQFESIEDVRLRAEHTGAAKIYIDTLTDRYLQDFALPALQAHARYEGKYLLAAPLSRPLIAQRMVEIAHEVGADAVAHGATGRGNDQVRFYTSVKALDPRLTVLAPAIDWDLRSREEEIEYADRHGINVSVTKSTPYSIDTNIWGTSIECGELDDIRLAPPAKAWQLTTDPRSAPDEPAEVIVGFKTRGIYEAPAATILMTAHAELEALVLDRETLHHKQSIALRYAELVYYGYWFSDLRRAFDGFVATLQPRMTGEVTLGLYKGSCAVATRTSVNSRYDNALATYESGDTYDHKAGAGFAYAWALPLQKF